MNIGFTAFELVSLSCFAGEGPGILALCLGALGRLVKLAAFLQEMATYDQLPEFGVELARLLRDGEDEKGAWGLSLRSDDGRVVLRPPNIWRHFSMQTCVCQTIPPLNVCQAFTCLAVSLDVVRMVCALHMGVRQACMFHVSRSLPRIETALFHYVAPGVTRCLPALADSKHIDMEPSCSSRQAYACSLRR